jgi:glycosyltransferase involved in cell wall biosynthesis
MVKKQIQKELLGEKMNICMVVGDFPPNCGGIGYYVYNLSKKLVERGHSVTVITRGRWNKAYIHERIEGITIYKIRFIPIYPFHVRLHGVFLNRHFKLLEPNFDVVHLHSPLVPTIHTALPIVLTEHGTVTRGIDNSESIDMHSKVIKFFSREFISLDVKAIKNSDIITVVSHSCAKELRDIYKIGRRISIVNNGTDTIFFAPKERNDLKEPYILYTGRLDSRKGLVDLIESAKYVCQEHSDIKFILTGKGPNKKYLEQRINELSLNKNIYFAGFVDRSKLLEYYQNATIYVLPSYYEGLPTTLLEAMSCGIPSIATDVEGSSELITDGETGLLVPPRNPKRLADAILRLLEEEEFRQKLGDNARKHIVNNYDWEIITNKIEDIYKAAITTIAPGCDEV